MANMRIMANVVNGRLRRELGHFWAFGGERRSVGDGETSSGRFEARTRGAQGQSGEARVF